MAEDDGNNCYLQKFKLYETRSNFYMIGTDKSKAVWRVLTIDRLEPSELHIREDSTRYSADECQDLLTRIHEGNKSTGGLKFITNCYGIVGFVKFLGPYYMLIITQRKQIGTICGHSVYAVSKSEMIVLPSSKPRFSLSNSKSESRYKKLLCAMDLTKDFYFSYSYHIMRSLQKNLCNRQSGQVVYETMFVWNEFLTHGIRHHLKSTIWSVALVYGFFKQVKLSVAGKDLNLTLIARRSRYFAGTRYLKRGVNEKGRVANDVETEQIVFENNPASISTQITSAVQNRGSIPLFWSQESSRLNLKPDITLHHKDRNYQATKLHFENLANRYGNPIIIFNLIKTNERKPRESILRAEFIKAIDAVNAQLTEENRLRFLHLDLNRYSRSKTTNVLDMLGKVTNFAMPFTGFFHCQLSLDFKIEELPAPKKGKNSDCSCVDNKQCGLENIDTLRELKDSSGSDCCFSSKTYSVQKGVLRTNCIDCLDRTNVAQYAYGLSALGHQLHVLQMLDVPKIDLDSPLADDLMNLYEEMGDTLALQYGGSAAHNKIFCERRGQWPAATQSQELFRALQRYYNNAYVDPEKQDAINVFLGYFQPQQGKPALWELDSDQHFNVGKSWNGMLAGNSRLSFKRSLSEGSMLSEDNTIISDVSEEMRKHSDSLNGKKGRQAQDSKNLLEFTPDGSPYDCNASRARYVPGMACQQLFVDQNHISTNEHGTYGSSSNFLDLDWLSSSGNSCDESSLLCSPIETRSRESLLGDTTAADGDSSLRDITDTPNDTDLTQTDSRDTVQNLSERFKQWVLSAVTLCH